MNKVLIHEKHSLAVRWFHWINFPILSLMVWTGILIYWANEAYIIIPESVANFLGISHRLSQGMAWHFFLMWIFAINGILYVSYLLVSGQWRDIFPTRHTFYQAYLVVLHDLKISKVIPPQDGKFNGAQRIAYTSIIFIGLGCLLTGAAIYKPVQLGFLTNLLGGYEAARLEHFILMIAVILFFFTHVAQVAKAGWNNFRSMVTGYEIKDEVLTGDDLAVRTATQNPVQNEDV